MLSLLLALSLAGQQANPDNYMQSVPPGTSYGVGALVANRCRPVTIDGIYNTAGAIDDDDLVLLPWNSQWTLVNTSPTGAGVKLCLGMTTTATLAAFSGSHGGEMAFDSYSGTGHAECITLPSSGFTTFQVLKSRWGCKGTVESARQPPTCRLGRCTAVAAVASLPDPVVGGGCRSNAECGTGTCSFTINNDGTFGPAGVYAYVCANATSDQVVSLDRAGPGSN